MFFSPKLYFRDYWISAPLSLVLLIQAIIWWYVIANIKPSEDQFFLHYNMVLGVNLVGPWWKLYLIPGSAFLVFLINYFLSLYFYNSDKLLARLLSIFTFLFHLLLLVGVSLLIRINV